MGKGKTRKMRWLKPWQYHGSVYGIVPAKTGYLKPVGEWNQETIIAIDDHGVAQHLEREVVEQDTLGLAGERLAQAVQRFDLDFDGHVSVQFARGLERS